MPAITRVLPRSLLTIEVSRQEKMAVDRRVRAANYIIPCQMSYLEGRSIRAPSLSDYRMRADDFLAWCRQERHD